MVNKIKDIDHSYIDDSDATINDSPAYESKNVSDRDIFRFAKAILMMLAVIFLAGMGIECYHPGSAVFEACKLTVPSLATLVIGYYFGTTK
jgi:hypothetical protein